MTRIVVVALTILLTLTGVASALDPQLGTYDLEWSILHVPVSSDLPDLQAGTTAIRLENATTAGGCPPTSAFVVFNAPAFAIGGGGSTTWCIRSDGSFDTSSNTHGDGAWVQYTADVFYVVAHNRRGNDTVQAVGRLGTTPPPPPPTTLKVFITQPRSNETVSGTAWVVLWVEGTSGSSNIFTLTADGSQVGTQTTSSRGPVTLPWDTRSVINGAHTLTGTVRDANGNTGTTSISVIVKN